MRSVSSNKIHSILFSVGEVGTMVVEEVVDMVGAEAMTEEVAEEEVVVGARKAQKIGANQLQGGHNFMQSRSCKHLH